MVAVTHVWHFWLAVPLALTAFGIGFGIVVGYLNKVVRPRYRQDD